VHFTEPQLGHISKDAAGHKISELLHQSKVLMNSMVLTVGRPGSGVDILSELIKFLSLSRKLCSNLMENYVIDFGSPYSKFLVNYLG